MGSLYSVCILDNIVETTVTFIMANSDIDRCEQKRCLEIFVNIFLKF